MGTVFHPRNLAFIIITAEHALDTHIRFKSLITISAIPYPSLVTANRLQWTLCCTLCLKCIKRITARKAGALPSFRHADKQCSCGSAMQLRCSSVQSCAFMCPSGWEEGCGRCKGMARLFFFLCQAGKVR